ncbi:(+)-neomenthol dehydrogenase-like [Nicotiana tomentosiformis]|uniref:(+)-neomenthol dehydrogenase-like n=1 Tax=Nicotiana tomentosiformis TaxID=4098 RepID=UPI00388C3490
MCIEGDFVTISAENGEEGGIKKSIAGIERIVTDYELTKQCLETNFYGAKRMIEAFIPLLQLSNSPRIVSVASFLGKLKGATSSRLGSTLTSTWGRLY